jgi:hypothetical protein
MSSAGRTADEVVVTMRRTLLAIAGLGTVAVALELATGRHWAQPRQLVAWAAVALLAAAVGTAAAAERHQELRAAVRLLAGTVILLGSVGVLVHVVANHDAGPLNGSYGIGWDQRPAPVRWWLAATKTVGPAPPLAPGLLALQGSLVLLVTFGPAERRARTDHDQGLRRIRLTG